MTGSPPRVDVAALDAMPNHMDGGEEPLNADVMDTLDAPVADMDAAALVLVPDLGASALDAIPDLDAAALDVIPDHMDGGEEPFNADVMDTLDVPIADLDAVALG